jgi:hypothetical protein
LRPTLRPIVVFVFIVAGGCSSSPKVCAPGQQIACACPGGGSGAQVCNSAGTGYGTCSGCGSGDAGAPDSGSSDSGVPDAGSHHGVLLAVHASADFPPARFCLGTGNQPDGGDTALGNLPALPHVTATGAPYPAVFPGTGQALPDVGDFSQVVVTPFLIQAQTIASETSTNPNEKSCQTLLGTHGQGGTLTLGTDFFPLTPIPSGSLTPNSTALVTVEGCVPSAFDGTASTMRCGADYVSAGNLKARTHLLAGIVAGPGSQVAHASPALDGVEDALAPSPPVTQHVSLFNPDAGAASGVALTFSGINDGQLAPSMALSLPAGAFQLSNAIGVTAVDSSGNNVVASAFPLSAVAIASGGSAATYFNASDDYVFVLVGDPTASQTLLDGGPNGYAVHVVAYPENIAAPSFP